MELVLHGRPDRRRRLAPPHDETTLVGPSWVRRSMSMSLRYHGKLRIPQAAKLGGNDSAFVWLTMTDILRPGS